MTGTSATGFVSLIGAGPGDPELLTVKALRRLEEAEVVVFDRLVSREILDRIPAGTTRMYAGKALDRHHLPQDQINELLVGLGRAGRRVVRLKGGDPFIFGRGSEEAEVLAAAGIPFEIVPGISAASGCSAYSGIPLTHRGLATGVHYITGHAREGSELDHDWRGLADRNTTIVVYMGLAKLPEIVEHLLTAGKAGDTPAAVVENGTTARQRTLTTTLADLPDAVTREGFRAPSIVVIGSVVELGATLSWYQPRGADADVSAPWTDARSG